MRYCVQKLISDSHRTLETLNLSKNYSIFNLNLPLNDDVKAKLLMRRVAVGCGIVHVDFENLFAFGPLFCLTS